MILLLIIGVILVSCSELQTGLDDSGLNDVAKSILKDFQTPDKKGVEIYLSNFNLSSGTEPYNPDTIQISPLDVRKWQTLELPDKSPVVMEKLVFQSQLTNNSRALFYLYRKNSLQNGKAILWVPGFGVSDFAFNFIKKFFTEELEEGYSVLFYVFPYHLERTVPGKKEGEGFITSDPVNNLETIRISMKELRTGIKFLKGQGVKTIGGWGGSAGASMLLLLSGIEDFDHLALMIPVVDWNTLIFNKAMEPVLKKLIESGVDENTIVQAYDKISPNHYATKTSPDRIFIMAAKQDRLTPEKNILDFGASWNITNIRGYPESHSTILLNGTIYRDYLDFLKRLQP